MVFIELAMLPLIPVTTTWLMSVTDFAGLFAGFLDVAPVSSAFASISCGAGALAPVLVVGGGFGVVCADAFSTPAMASSAAAHANANGRKRVIAREPCNAQRDFMMDALRGGGSRQRRQADLARGTCRARARVPSRQAGKRGGTFHPPLATGSTHAPPVNNGDKTPRAMWRL
ncbi:hypothetical protein [Rhodanobacter caeni]|uniref:hypothetical protein n=1 Tax=Rhodanobacter caeni TaxID=657654 RepID=UPI0031E07915